jgi:hypothetical protein
MSGWIAADTLDMDLGPALHARDLEFAEAV